MAAVRVELGTGPGGEKLARFTPLAGSPGLYRRILGGYGLRGSKSQGAGYVVRLDAALSACGALQKRGVELRAKKEVPEIIKASAWKCEVPGLYPYQRVGAEYLHSRRRAILADQMGTGKAQPVSSLVLRPDGIWTPIGDLRVGDHVVGSNGLPTRVVGVFPQGRKKIVELTFSDGAMARSTEDHLWAVRTPFMKWWGSPFKPKTLKEILARGLYKNKGRDKQWFIPVPLAPDFPMQKDLLIAPYLLGALIANGELSKSSVMHSGPAEQREHMRPYLPDSLVYTPCKNNKWDFRIVKRKDIRRTDPNPLVAAMRALGLAGTESHQRFIPENYLRGSVEQRKDLLQGLMDNDGCISRDGMVIEYNTTSPKLAGQVIYLVRSLGGVARMSTRYPRFSHLGKKKIGRRDHRIRVALDFCPFRASWKRERYVPRSKYPPVRAIVAVKGVGTEECVCIAVSAHDSLYITNDFVLTHNTPQALSALDPAKGALIIVPSVVCQNWLKEATRWRRDLVFRIWKEPYPLFPEPGEANIVTYPKLPYEQLERRSRCPWCDALSVVPLDDEEVMRLAAKQLSWTDVCDPVRGGRCIKTDGQPGARKFQQNTAAWPEWVWVGEKPKHPVQLVVDEGHYCKNKNAQRTIAVRTIAATCAAGEPGQKSSVWILTGTPLLNEPSEIWSLCQLFPGQTGKFDDGAWDTFGSWSGFVEMFDGKKQVVGGISRGYEWGGQVKPEAREHLGAVMLRRMRDDVLPDLPKKTRRYITVPISKRALSKDAMLTDNLLLLFKEWSDDKVLAECAAGGALSMLRKELAALKLDTLVKLVKEYEENQEPVVVFSYHRDPIIALGERKGWGCITGSTEDHERAALVERFQKGRLLGLAGTIGAMGVGVTLTRAANMLFLDRDFVPANNLQAEDRELRIGQERGVVITILEANHPIDERVAIILEKKERLLEAMELSEDPAPKSVTKAPAMNGASTNDGPLFDLIPKEGGP